MARNPLRVAHQRALKVDHDLAHLFHQHLGTVEHPRGHVRSVYRTARPMVEKALADGGPMAKSKALDTTRTLRQTLYNLGGVAIAAAEDVGRQSAVAQLAAYNEAGAGVQAAMEYPDRGALLDGWYQVVDSQLDTVDTLLLTGADLVLLVGDSSRLGVLQPDPLNRQFAYWLAFAASAAFAAWLIGRNGQRAEQVPFRRQAVPAIDLRTTPCCLDVAKRGEVVGMNEPFYTPEPPAYGKRQMWTPFHEWCRTSTVLYLPEFDDGITDSLRESALAELGRRAGS